MIHSLSQKWHERLPMYLLEERRRVPIFRAPTQALQEFSNESLFEKRKTHKTLDLTGSFCGFPSR
jgi:hypothetical protein